MLLVNILSVLTHGGLVKSTPGKSPLKIYYINLQDIVQNLDIFHSLFR